METTRSRIVVMALASLALATSLAWGICDEPLVLGWETWEPYQFVAERELRGFDIELMNAIVEDIDCELAFQKRPWGRLLEELEEGEVDFVVGAFRNAERERFAWISPPYRRDRVELWVAPGSDHELSELSDLAGSPFRLGVTRGYYYGSAFGELLTHPDLGSEQIVEVADSEDLLPMLRRGKIDGFLADRVYYSHYLRENGLWDHVVRHGLSVSEEDTFILMSRVSVPRELANAVSASLERLRGDGTYARIQAKYLGTTPP